MGRQEIEQPQEAKKGQGEANPQAASTGGHVHQTQGMTTGSTARLVMINQAGQETNKRSQCWKWTREQFGYGWHNPEEKPLPRL